MEFGIGQELDAIFVLPLDEHWHAEEEIGAFVGERLDEHLTFVGEEALVRARRSGFVGQCRDRKQRIPQVHSSGIARRLVLQPPVRWKRLRDLVAERGHVTEIEHPGGKLIGG